MGLLMGARQAKTDRSTVKGPQPSEMARRKKAGKAIE